MGPRALTIGLVLAATAVMPAQAAPPVTADPEVGTPDTAFRVSVPATFPIKQKTRDRYWFFVHGPGGRQCETSVSERVGITPAGHPRTVSVDLPGVRIVTSKQIVPGPWCPGTFTGRVEFRDWRPRTHRVVTRRIGTFSFTVQDGQ